MYCLHDVLFLLLLLLLLMLLCWLLLLLLYFALVATVVVYAFFPLHLRQFVCTFSTGNYEAYGKCSSIYYIKKRERASAHTHMCIQILICLIYTIGCYSVANISTHCTRSKRSSGSSFMFQVFSMLFHNIPHISFRF